MAHLTSLTLSTWSEDPLAEELSATGGVEALELDNDMDEERQTYQSNVAALEAEVRRLNLELRAALEAKVDQEASQLAREHGFLSPFISKSTSFFASTPQSHRFSASQPSPMGLNASTILDDDAGFSFDGLQSPALTSSGFKPWDNREGESPTSRLFKTPSRPRPLFITAPKNTYPSSTPQTPHFLHADLVPLPEEEATSSTAPSSPQHGPTPNKLLPNGHQSPRSEQKRTPSSKRLLPNSEISDSDRLATSAPVPPSASKSSIKSSDRLSTSASAASQGSSTPSGQLVLPPIQLTPESDSSRLNASFSRASRQDHSPSLARDTPKQTPLKNINTPIAGTPYSQMVTPSIIRQGNALSHHYPYGAEPETRVLTKLVYVPKTTHWCEHICLILFVLLVIAISFSFGFIISQTGPPDWLQANTAMYS